MEHLELILSESLGLALLNAVSRQQLDGISASAVTVAAAAEILGTRAQEAESRTGSLTAVEDLPQGSEAKDFAGGGADKEHAGIAGNDAAGMALQYIAQAVALSVQDAADHLRNLRTLHTAAFGRHLRFVDGKDVNKLEKDSSELQAIESALGREKTAFHDFYTHAAAFLEQLSKEKSSASSATEVVDDARAFPELTNVPAVAMGNLFVATSQALSNAAHNATTSQQQTNITAQTANVQGITTLYSIDTASTAVSTRGVLNI